MRQVGVREFKTNLSRFLRAVQAGECIEVTDHGRVIAEVRSPGRGNLPGSEDARIQRLVDHGRLRQPLRAGHFTFGDLRGIGGAPAGSARELVDWERGER